MERRDIPRLFFFFRWFLVDNDLWVHYMEMKMDLLNRDYKNIHSHTHHCKRRHIYEKKKKKEGERRRKGERRKKKKKNKQKTDKII